MKIKLVPAINAKNFDEIKERLNLLKKLTNHFHLDIATIEATNYETWHNASELKKLPRELIIDLHLMTYLKPNDIFKWNDEVIKRFIIHPEYCYNIFSVLKQIKRFRKEIYLAWSPNIEFDFLERYLNYVNGLLVLGVNPGKSGQEFIEDTYKKLEFINKIRNYKKIKLMVDGGINKNNVIKIISYNPNFIIIASSIYSSERPDKSYIEFKNLLLK
ncbi:MAG: hypothetical protein KatS3mg095_0773 [Candidatus Parcubacteria bacterium]|nr:MAG: hypothetical protein KatS3mg095_0773 [Candidatus Parcubacteria bacterium]